MVYKREDGKLGAQGTGSSSKSDERERSSTSIGSKGDGYRGKTEIGFEDRADQNLLIV